MADFVLAVQEVVRGGRRDADLIDVVRGVVLFAADVEVFADLLAVFVHHGLDDAAKAKRNLVPLALLAAELLLHGEVVGELGVAGDEAGGAVGAFARIFGHGVLAGEFESKAVDGVAGLFGIGGA